MALPRFPRPGAHRRAEPAVVEPPTLADPAAVADDPVTTESAGTLLRQRWAPVVVDRAVAPFDPRPAPRPPYRPDTIVDAWSTSHFTVRLASVRGYAHRYYGTPRQDDVVAAVHRATGSLVFAVADGVSSAEQAEIGAGHACRTAMDGMLAALDAGPAGIDWTRLVGSVAARLIDQAAAATDPADDPHQQASRHYATTLVAGLARPTPGGLTATLVQVGDSGAWLLDRGRYVTILRRKSDPNAAVVESTVSALPQLPSRVQPVTVPLSPGVALLVGTDGFGDPLGDGDGMVGDLFREALASPPPPLGLAHALDFSRETFDDDRTLLVVWPLS